MSEITYYYNARLQRCVDGDTVDLDVDLGFYVWVRVRFRLYGIDTPERGKPGFKEATERLKELLLKNDGELQVYSRKTGKFGRWIGTLFVNDVNINEQMIEEGFAKAYP